MLAPVLRPSPWAEVALCQNFDFSPRTGCNLYDLADG